MPKEIRQSLKHTHKVKLIKYPSGYKEFFCTLPNCSYRVRAQLFLGKKSLCNNCGKEFEITVYHMRRTSPKCTDCIDIRESRVKPSPLSGAGIGAGLHHIGLGSLGSNSVNELENRLQRILSEGSSESDRTNSTIEDEDEL